MCQRTRKGTAEREGRPLIGEQADDMEFAGDDVSHAVEPALLAFAEVVEERGGEEVVVLLAALEEPVGGGRGMDDVAGVLRFEEGEERGREDFAGDGVVGGGGKTGRLAELPDAFAHARQSGRRLRSRCRR